MQHRTDIIPLGYWLRTRLPGAGNLVAYFLLYFCYCLVFAAGLGSLSLLDTVSFILMWAGYMSLYEIGYLANDSWAQKREHSKGLNLHKPVLCLPHDFLFTLIVARIFAFAILLATIQSLVGTKAALEFVALCAFMCVAFAAHNLGFYPWRVFTFFALYATRYLLAYVAFPNYEPSVLAPVLLLAPALALAVSYGISKGTRFEVAGNVSFHVRLTFLFALLTTPATMLFDVNILRPTVSLLVFLLSADLAFGVARFVREALRACNDSCIYHAHTNFSHDCSMDISTIVKMPFLAGRTVFLTDHVETFDASKYSLLQQQAESATSKGVRLIVGLEYPISGQHILAFGLRTFTDVDAMGPKSVSLLRQNSERVVWAHPHFAIRKLASPPYILALLRLMRFVDGFEFVNLKSSRGSHFHWRHIVVALVGIVLFGSKFLSIGVDAHEAEDFTRFDRLESVTPRWRLYYCLFKGGLVPPVS